MLTCLLFVLCRAKTAGHTPQTIYELTNGRSNLQSFPYLGKIALTTKIFSFNIDQQIKFIVFTQNLRQMRFVFNFVASASALDWQ